MKTEEALDNLPSFREVLAVEYVPEQGQSILYCRDGSDYTITDFPETLIGTWCLIHGCTLKGRVDAAGRLCGISRKAPVLISEQSMVMFFPMKGILDHRNRGVSNLWINESQIIHIREKGRDRTVVSFVGGRELEIPYSIRMLRRSMKHCQTLREALAEAQRKAFPSPRTAG